ncbi:MAG: hypothetical protein F6K65_17855 [Moorea sp. SIO3C2]|nr:hypothetical protein [Moorena sp. SIO3C2]
MKLKTIRVSIDRIPESYAQVTALPFTVSGQRSVVSGQWSVVSLKFNTTSIDHRLYILLSSQNH